MNDLRTYLHCLKHLDGVRSLQYFNLMRFATTLLIGVVLAKSGLPPAQIALYEGWLFFANLFTFYWIIGGQNAVLQRFPRLSKHRQVPFFQAVFGLWLVFGLAVGSVWWWYGDHMVPLLSRFEQLPAMGWLAAFMWWHTPSWLVQAWYLLHKRYGELLVFGALSGLGQWLAVGVPVLCKQPFQWVFAALGILALAKMLWAVRLVFLSRGWRPWWGGVKVYLAAAAPLMAHVLVGQSVDYIDGLIVGSHFEEAWFAIYRYGARELPLSLLLVGAMVTGSIPLVAMHGDAVLEVLKRRIARLSHLLFPLSIVLMWLSPWAFRVVYSESFVYSAQVFNVYLLLVGSRVLLPQVVLIGMGHNKVLVYSALCETVLNVALSLWWLHYWGVIGIAMASVVAYLCNKALLMGWAWWRLGIAPHRYWPWKVWLVWHGLLWLSWLATLSVAY